MKEFDVYLNNRLTACDILVYSIPFRDGITAIHKAILECCLAEYTLAKHTAANNRSELNSHLDKMIKICNEALNINADINTEIEELSVHYTMDPKSISYILDAVALVCGKISAGSGESCISLTATVDGTEIMYSLGEIDTSDMYISVALDGDTSINKYEMLDISVSILSEILESARKYGGLYTNPSLLFVEIQEIIRRYRLLSEIDATALYNLGDMTLSDLDYVVL